MVAPLWVPVRTAILGAGFSKAVSHCMPLTDALGKEVWGRMWSAGVDPVARSYSGTGFEAWLSRLAEPQPDLSMVENHENRVCSSAFHLPGVSSQWTGYIASTWSAMGDDMANLSVGAQQAVQAVEELPAADKKPAVQEILRANRDLFPDNDSDRTKLWIVLLIGLFIVALSALVGSVILTLKTEDSTALVAIVSAVVAGVIGLFSKSPTSSS